MIHKMSDNNNCNDEKPEIFDIQNLNIFEDETDDIDSLRRKNRDMQAVLTSAVKLLTEKNQEYSNMEKQNKALNIQVGCLKDVVAITKNLLNIRNLEIESMRDNLASLETKISSERERQNEVIKTVSASNRINEDIKNEYQSQMNIFQQLKDKYNEKVALLTKENERLQNEMRQLITAELDK